ncbi:Nif3-like dinuclear metal center hexameric protein [Limnoglobus roseus]|uniref:GTP cyclohydrolase 1 type 2 homolog n=1 Tax=Limnoglobus roseus TaxID=2598579 RepID=A0A5C1AR59_9BACT|nr:Nif3-like dinuclear metal center hexameric protein [Limnoglobus roseus]QEL19684.1 Nif3-like dinuclear metal center hexameric protein [Limnoglobus roseus]
MPTVADFSAYLEPFAPLATAADWDNVGLLLGDATGPADRVMTCLTVTPDVVAEAVADGVELIVSHHPILFRGAKKLSSHTSDGRLLLPLMRAGIAVYSPHTAFDNCPGGINDGLCRRLEITKAVPLRPREAAKKSKLVVFVPDADLSKVSDALFAAGAGRIGQYEQCSYRLNGTGTFFGTDATNPTVGEKGRREEVAEWRLEVVVPDAKLDAALAAMRAAHSYEEPAFDVYPLATRGEVPTAGEGRIGDLAPVTLGEFAERVKKQLRAAVVQIGGDPTRIVRRAAVACGAAGEFLSDAVRRKADVFVTGEIRFHDARTAEAAGVGLVVPGHHATERPAVEDLAAQLGRDFPTTTVWASRRERDPLAGTG